MLVLQLFVVVATCAVLIPGERERHAHIRTTLLQSCRAPTLVDEVVVGGGPAGLHYVYRRSSLSGQASIVLLDDGPTVGGALRGKELRHPVTGQFNATYPYRISLGALRSAGSLSYHAQRCLFAELNIPVEFSPSQGQFNNRGASVKCGPAVWNGPDAPQDPYAASPFQWGDSQCSSNDVWTNETTGRFVGIAKGFESSVYNWLVGYSDVHPKTGVSGPYGVDLACLPENRHLDIRTFLARELGSHEAAEFMKLFNFGFLGDFSVAASACGWSSFTQREYDTSNVFAYPLGGMQTLTDRMLQKARTNAVQQGHSLIVNERSRVESVDANAPGSSHPFRISGRDTVTNEAFVFDAKKVVLAIGPSFIEKLSGSVAATLKASAFVKETKAVPVVTVNLQFPTRWWANFSDTSFRVMGDGSCLSRTEFLSSPFNKQLNVARAGYSDYQCREIYENIDRFPEPERTNRAVEFVVSELRRLFPNSVIPDPIGYPWNGNADSYIGASFTQWKNGPWHWLRAGAKHSHADVASFAQNPIPGSDLCLAGDAWDLDYSGWTNSAIRSSANCVDRFFPGREWKPASTKCCEARLPVGDGYFVWEGRYNVQGCGEELWSPGPRYLANERWWPLYEAWQGGDAAVAACVLPNYTDQCASTREQFRYPAPAAPAAAAARRRADPRHGNVGGGR